MLKTPLSQKKRTATLKQLNEEQLFEFLLGREDAVAL